MTAYKLYWSLNDFAEPVKVLNAQSLQTSTNQLDGVVTGDWYSYFVVATNLIGDSEPSPTLVNAVAGTTPDAPLNFGRSTTITAVDDEISL